MSETDARRIENIAYGDVRPVEGKHKRTVKRLLHWQRRIWKAEQK